MDTIGVKNIKGTWFDFDGRLMHHTLPFVGERYSLVYFNHLSWKLPEASNLITRVLTL